MKPRCGYESVTNKKSIRIIAELEELKRRVSAPPAQLAVQLRQLSRRKFPEAEALIHFHEALLFFRAYPHSASVLKQVEDILKTFDRRVSQFRDAHADLSPFDDPEVSGIAGTSVTSNFSYAIVRWLVKKYPTQISIDWGWLEDDERFGTTMPRFLPLLEEDAMVEAHVPYRDWLRAAKGRANELVWLIARFESLQISDKAKTELYDSLKLHMRWEFKFHASRTGMRLPVRKIFFHQTRLIQRRDISLAAELVSPPIPWKRLSRAAGERILDMARETSAVRYRELHGFTYGDSRRMLKADLGLGIKVFVMGVPPEHRLPLRAYHAALIFKNGIPVAYFEGLSLFERMESGFNLYYTFREGETAWLFARILRLMRQLLGVTVISIDPYQIGHHNEEGIESGAFWFYRKFGFRPVRPELMKLALTEEEKIAANPAYRTPSRTLKKLAVGHLLFEMPRGKLRQEVSEWDRFEVRNVGLAVQRRMARDFDGDAHKLRAHSANFVEGVLGRKGEQRNTAELHVLESFAPVLAMIPEIARWKPGDKQLAARILQAKANRDEALYLKLMQQHEPLRAAVIQLGSSIGYIGATSNARLKSR